MANIDRSVWELQAILVQLGVPAVDQSGKPFVDKTYGPVTERTWSLLSSRLGLDPYIKQVSPLIASVNQSTHAKLLNEYVLRRSPKPSGSNDFERLNNAIRLLDSRQQKNPEAQTLAADWDRIASSPNWRSFVGALPPVWATSLLLYWDRYFDVWGKLPTNEKTALVHPATVEPGGVFSANVWKDLWDPALDAAKQAGKTLLQSAGQQLAKGAAEETQKQTYEWLYSLGGVALGALGLYWLLRDKKAA